MSQSSTTRISQVDERSVRLFSVNYWPEPTGIGPYVTEFAEHLADLGLDVEVVTAHPHYPAWRAHSDYEGRGVISEERNGVRIRRVPVTLPDKMNLIGRARFEFSYFRRARRLNKKLEPRDVTIGYSPGLSSGLMAMVSGKQHGGHRLVVQDLAGKGIEQSSLTSLRFVVGLVRSIESRAARTADSVVAISEAFVEPLVDEGVDRDRITVLSNWQKNDSQPTDPAVTARYRGRFAPNGETLVMHSGSIGAKQGLEQLLEAAAGSVDDNVRFVLVGDGGERVRLEALARPLDTVEFADPVPADELSSMLASADVLVLSQSRNNVDMSFPSKLSSYFGSGVPILACVPPGGSVANYLETNGAGLVVDGKSPRIILAAIASLQDDAELRTTLTERAIDALCDWDSGLLLQEWTETLVGPRAGQPNASTTPDPVSSAAS